METRSPASVLPSATRPAPISSTASVPRFGQRLHHRVEQAADPADGDQAVAQLVGAGAEALGLRRLPAEGLDDERGVEALVRDLADLGAQLLGPLHPRAT